jgi:hypothetical protein
MQKSQFRQTDSLHFTWNHYAKAHLKVLDRVLAAAAALSLKLGLAPVLFAATPRSPSRPSRGRESLRGLAVALRRLRLAFEAVARRQDDDKTLFRACLFPSLSPILFGFDGGTKTAKAT